MAMDAQVVPVRIRFAAGQLADRARAVALIDGIAAEYPPADRWYDTAQALAAARSRGMTPRIPPQRSRKTPQLDDEASYQRVIRWRTALAG